ncbi:hypothetical protein MFLO_13840 [Listeria floridensis FSL S10-1187]|uniref:Uncharacterized protein n=1 Tax=Listeria floridensis FSL S10-1187 TaxID=1265817 RepID=A0ABP3AUY1_9LIST|nr:hypothetical protein [Listeria floridensis]EUJ26958.1 hypothetical protein MFLO_13840 [Listeria floridensis FSL S10-1187]
MESRNLRKKKEDTQANKQNFDLSSETFTLKLGSGIGMSFIFIPCYYLKVDDTAFHWIENQFVLLLLILLGAMVLIEVYMLINTSTLIKMKSRALKKK